MHHLAGVHFLSGDDAMAEGAISAGCRFFAGYPITPASEIAEHMSVRLPQVGGIFIQMEDEIASMAAIVGASWAGAKPMTATSGPGFSLMMENYGLAFITETPCVIVNVMRGGPSTGLPTLVGQGDVMQARWGTHGDFTAIALSPNSPQEAFDLTVEAFNLAEEYRTPVVVLTDEVVGHMTERVVIPPRRRLKIVNRRRPRSKKNFVTYGTGRTLIPPMPPIGEGYRFHVTGLTHDENGYPAVNAKAEERLIRRLLDKIQLNADRIIRYEEVNLDPVPDVIVVAYGITSRPANAAVKMARVEGMSVGMFRPITIWPFPEKRIDALSRYADAFVVPEINYGQISLEVERCVHGRAKVMHVPQAPGDIHDPEVILNAIEEVIR